MAHIDTLKMFEGLRAAGIPEGQARAQVETLENSFSPLFKELKQDFASQKLVGLFGGLILLVGATTIGLLWRLSIDVELLKNTVLLIEKK
jgi:hypothetical protein